MDYTVPSRQVQIWQSAGEKVVFTNGCFDILHAGHISLLEQSAALGNRLVIGLNSDDSVRRLKGAHRPIQSEDDRCRILAALRSVDLVVIFDEDTPAELITALRPDVLVKGADYRLDAIVGADTVSGYGGEVVRIKLEPGHSSSAVIEKIRQTGTREKS